LNFLDLTLPTPAENLACDEALLDACEAGADDEVLRFWEPKETFVVLGYGNRAATEVRLDACRAAGVPVLRRCSGGGTVLQGAGCLNYSLILRIQESGPLQTITGTNEFVLEKNHRALESLVKSPIQRQGQTDLTINGIKFSGNAQRRKRSFLIFHGTFLLNFNIASVGKFLSMPSQQPDYRRNRGHEEFLTNLNLSPEAVKSALKNEWQATTQLHNVPADLIEELNDSQYSTAEWNFRI
jgi:lipoate-protein ligase A